MASGPLLDFQALTAPIPGDDPAGSSVPFDIRAKLEDARKEEDPADFAPDDPMRPEVPRRADWSGIARLTQQVLTETSKDLLVSARLTEALTKLHGFAGLRDGLHLIHELVEHCWNRLKPPIEDGDVEVRASPFHWLDDPDHGARFPSSVRLLPLVSGKERQFSWLDWRAIQDGKGQTSVEEFEKVVQESSAEQCRTMTEQIEQSLQELSQLTQSLGKHMKESAPALTSLRQALEECYQLSRQITARKGATAASQQMLASSDAAAGGLAAGVAGNGEATDRAVTSRAEAYRQLARAAAVLQQLEPHSPIPYLVQRAVQLGELPFPQMIKALIREQAVLAELNRELGIQEPGETPPA